MAVGWVIGSVEACCRLDAIGSHLERGEQLEPGAFANVWADMGAEVPRALTQSSDVEQAGANVPLQSIHRGTRDATDEQAPVSGRQVHGGHDASG
jgi:hypothetical protein